MVVCAEKEGRTVRKLGIGINYVFYIKDISGHVANALSFFPLIIAIRFGRLLIEDMKKKESKEE